MGMGKPISSIGLDQRIGMTPPEMKNLFFKHFDGFYKITFVG